MLLIHTALPLDHKVYNSISMYVNVLFIGEFTKLNIIYLWFPCEDFPSHTITNVCYKGFNALYTIFNTRDS